MHHLPSLKKESIPKIFEFGTMSSLMVASTETLHYVPLHVHKRGQKDLLDIVHINFRMKTFNILHSLSHLSHFLAPLLNRIPIP